MRSPTIAGEGLRLVTLRTSVLLVAISSRVLCLFLVTQWPRYFDTYHTSSQLLHPKVPPLQDRAGWRLPGKGENICRFSWVPGERAVTVGGDGGDEGRCQQVLSETGNALQNAQCRQLSTEQPIPLLPRRRKGVTLLPVFLAVDANGLHTLANAPLQAMRVQAFLSSSDRQSFVAGTTPSTATRPLPFSVRLDRCHENEEAGKRRRTTAGLRFAAAGEAGAKKLKPDRWLWLQVMPLLSWDGEYYMGCALQRTRYYFEMTHAFFPGLSTTYLIVKESIWPALHSIILQIFPVCIVNLKLFSAARGFSDAFVLSDATCYGLIAAIVSNVAFVLATVGVFEIARKFASPKSADLLQFGTANIPVNLKEVDEYALCAQKRLFLSTAPSKTIDPGGQRHLSRVSGHRFKILRSLKHFETNSEPLNATISIETGCSYPAEEDVTHAPFECIAGDVCPESEAFWAAFWYAFSGASVHMSAAYTESLFACLSVWGLLLLSWAEESTRSVGGVEGPPVSTTENTPRTESQVQLSRTSLFEWYGSRWGIQPTTAPHLPSPQLTSELARRNEALQLTRGAGGPGSLRQYFFSWAATLLFCSGALLRSNGSLSLIPLFFHTLRTCPGIRSIQTLFTSGVSRGKRRVADDGLRVSTAVHIPSTSARYRPTMSLAKLSVVVLLHWLNALLQALVVLLPLFLVLAYPYYLYCACAQAVPRAHSQSNAQTVVWCRESRLRQFLPTFPRRLSIVRSSPAYVAPSCSAIKSFQTDGLPESSRPSSSTIDRERSKSQTCPPSFTAFALSSLNAGLPHSLQKLTCSVGLIPDNLPGVRYIWDLYNYVSDRTKGDYVNRKEKFENAGCYKECIWPPLNSEGGRAEARSTPPPWCASTIPNVYSYAQKQYWGVEFLGFLRVKTLYLVMMSAPFYALSVLCVIHLLARCCWSPKESCSASSRTCPRRTHHQRRHDAGARRRRQPRTFLKNGASARTEKLFNLLLENETGQVVQLAVLSIIMFFFAHANVFVRLSTACPIYFLHMARLHAAYSRTVKLVNEHQLSRPKGATLALEGRTRTARCDGRGVEKPVRNATVFLPHWSGRTITSQRLWQLPGTLWWDWWSALVLGHHFLGPLLFSCYITWT